MQTFLQNTIKALEEGQKELVTGSNDLSKQFDKFQKSNNLEEALMGKVREKIEEGITGKLSDKFEHQLENKITIDDEKIHDT